MHIKLLAVAAILIFCASTLAANSTEIKPLYCKMLDPSCGIEDNFYLDAPWHASGNFPVYAILNTQIDMQIRYIKIYDAFSGKLVDVHDFGTFTVKKESHPYFFEFNINPNNLQKNKYGEVSLKAVFGIPDSVFENSEGPITIKISENLPRIENWYAGDIHYHTNSTSNFAEFGAPFPETKKAAKTIGLDFIAVTDHSFDLSEEKWQQIIGHSAENSDNTFVFIPGEEVSTNDESTAIDPIERYRHYLAIGISSYIAGSEFEANFGITQLTPRQLVDEVNKQGGAGYVAHPYYGDIARKPWEEDDYGLNFTGLQIWNYNDWRKDTGQLEKGLQKWRNLLADGRRVYIGAGSDSHGDFQLLGRARTYVYAEILSQMSVLEALKNGNSFITDGPLLVAYISGATFGQEALVEEGANAEIKLQFTSNSEFGKISSIEIWRGDELVAIVEPNSYFEAGYKWTDKTAAKNSYYRFVSRTELGYSAYTNPIWIKTFSKPAEKIIAKKDEGIAKKAKDFVSPLIKMPSIIIEPWLHPIHSLGSSEIIELYKTDEMRKIDSITSSALEKFGKKDETPGISAQNYMRSGKIEQGKGENTETGNYTIERYGGRVHFPN